MITLPVICSKQNREYKHDTLMNARQILQIRYIKPKGSTNPSTKLCFYRRMLWLVLTFKNYVSGSK